MSSPSNRDVDFELLDAEIRRLRDAGEPLAALRKLMGVKLNLGIHGLLGKVKKLWDDHLFVGDCLLLEAGHEAVQSKSRGTRANRLRATFQDFDKLVDELGEVWRSVAWAQVRARSRLIQAMLDDLSGESLERELREVLDVYAAAWPRGEGVELEPVQTANPHPAWLATPSLPPRLAEMLRDLGTSPGVTRAAWHFVAESVAFLGRPARRFDRACHAETWILLAGPPATESADHWKSLGLPAKGLVAKLCVERVDRGCGAVYPHPARAGYLRVDPAFAASVHDALSAVIELDGVATVAASDYRWSMELVGKHAADYVHVPLTGPSAGLAFAVAIRATVRDEDLDTHVACTAQFRRPTLALAKVGHVLRKAAAQDLADRQVTEILVTHGQDVDAIRRIESPTTPPGWNLTLVPVEDLRTAYERMAKFPRITRAVKDYLAARSQRILDFVGRPYIRPFVGRLKDQTKPGPTAQIDDYDPLKKEELAALFDGFPDSTEALAYRAQPSAQRETQDPKKERPIWRVRLFADSGFGKSTLLVELEREIANGAHARVPIRFGAGFEDVPLGTNRPVSLPHLSNQLFTGDIQQVAERLADKLLPHINRSLPAHQRRLDREDFATWFQRKIEHHEMIFLLDAADQSVDQLDQLAEFLCQCPQCAAVVSGRPETVQTAPMLWARQSHAWQTIYACGFRETEWTKYFVHGAPDGEQEARASRARAIWNNKDLQALVQPPILAGQVKELELAGELSTAKNRFRVYSEAVRRLVAKGLQSLKVKVPNQLHECLSWSSDRIISDFFTPLAWDMLQVEIGRPGGGRLTGKVNGDEYGAVERQSSRALSVLWQLDLVTSAMLETRAPGEYSDEDAHRLLSWRHLSFFEYFVGRAIAVRPQEFATLAERYARTPQWRWPFRFALSSLAGDHRRSQDLATLAECLIKYGNPFVVYEGIEHDQIALDPELDGLCRWLVHQDRDTRAAFTSDRPPRVTPRVLGILESAFQLKYRDSRYLYAAWELLELAGDELREQAHGIRGSFLGEFPALKAKNRIAWELDHSFVRCPPREKRAPEDADHRPFVQGTQGGRDHEYPHQVIVSPFELMNFLVTNAQFELFAPRHPRFVDNATDDQPVKDVTWFEAKMFAIWAGADLPTEAQWEYAARAGAESQYCRIADAKPKSGFRDLDTEDELNLVANYGDHIGQTTPRGEFLPNWWGLYDMLGNVYEWCRDWYSEKYYREVKKSIAADPVGPWRGVSRVVRGGCWSGSAGDCRSADRSSGSPDRRSDFKGFRLARVPQAEPVPAGGKGQRTGAKAGTTRRAEPSAVRPKRRASDKSERG